MKKTMLLRLLFLLCLPRLGNAQFQKNSWMIGGDAALTRSFIPTNTFGSNDNARTATELKLNSNIGYFINPRTMVGVGLSVNHSKLEYKDTLLGSNKYRNWAISPFIRRYWGRDGGKFQYFAQAEVVLEDLKWKNLSSAGFAGSVGVDYFLTKNVALEGSIRVDDQLRSFFNGGVKLFLNTPKEENRQIVADSFLKKGNRIFFGGLTKKNFLERNIIALSVGAKVFIKNNTALYINLENTLSVYSSAKARIGIEHYFRITPNTQIYIGGGLMYSKNQFLASVILEKPKRSFGTETFIGVNKFIAPNISVFGQVNFNATRNLWTNKTYLQTGGEMGFRYYF